MLSMYKAIERLLIVVVVLSSRVTCESDAILYQYRTDIPQTGVKSLRKKMELPMGAMAPAHATMNVMNHFIFRG